MDELHAFASDALPPLDQAIYLVLIGYGSARLFKNATYWTDRLGIFVFIPFLLVGLFMGFVHAMNKEAWSAVALCAFIVGFIQRGAS